VTSGALPLIDVWKALSSALAKADYKARIETADATSLAVDATFRWWPKWAQSLGLPPCSIRR
jgi:hypothetical protein